MTRLKSISFLLRESDAQEPLFRRGWKLVDTDGVLRKKICRCSIVVENFDFAYNGASFRCHGRLSSAHEARNGDLAEAFVVRVE